MQKAPQVFTIILILGFVSQICLAQSSVHIVKSKTNTETSDRKVPKDSVNENTEPSFEEVLADLRAAYKKVEHIDKTVVDGKDTLQLHETYYCLHDHSLVVPKMYIAGWGLKHPKAFIANTFATKIILINNRDTVLNRVFKRVDFNSALWDRLRKYAIIFTANYAGYDKTKHEFALSYSITIPLTDVGLGAHIAIDKKGNYRILDEYANMDSYKKE